MSKHHDDTSVKLRKTCDVCVQRRYRCNGQNPCSSCTRRLFVCHYSYFTRRKIKPGEKPFVPPETAGRDGQDGSPSTNVESDQSAAVENVDKKGGVTLPKSAGETKELVFRLYEPPGTRAMSSTWKLRPVPSGSTITNREPCSRSNLTPPPPLEKTPDDNPTVLTTTHPDVSPCRISNSIPFPMTTLDIHSLSEQMPILNKMFQVIVLFPNLTATKMQRLTKEERLPGSAILVENLRLLTQVLPLYFPEGEPPSCDALHQWMAHFVTPLTFDQNLLSLEEQIYQPEVVHQLTLFFFKYFVNWEPFLQSQRFFLKLGMGVVQPALVNSILCFATQLYHNCKPQTDILFDHSREYFSRAEYWILRDLENPTLDTVTGLVIMIVGSCGLDKLEELSRYAEMCQRLMVQLNLHLTDSPYYAYRNPQPLTLLQSIQQVSRRRVFWGSLFITALTGLADRTTACFDMDQVCVSLADDLDPRDFFLVDDPQHSLPTILWPMLNGVSITPSNCKLIYIMEKIFRLNQEPLNTQPIRIEEIYQLNQELRQWFSKVPPELRMTGQPGGPTVHQSTDEYYTMIRNNGLINSAYYLCIFLINSEKLLQRIVPPLSPQQLADCHTRILTTLVELTHCVALPVMTVPVPERPLNVYYYTSYGLLAALPILARLGREEQIRYKNIIDTCYTLALQYSPSSLFSQDLHKLILNKIKFYRIAWEPDEASGGQQPYLALDPTDHQPSAGGM
ncbi:hypothetical protein IWQ62_002377 [Dispira parvispora]|uniref:Zn(2)-C6 fungal-type domain-containing protein n=1 Tax=Dispira parvispora TaxID=1520584 RepID=A0A9W8AQH1_9FUNG|nr:hypothetical protein IWQ62_002377 [Dispira parvispora]